ncbi:MAG: DUF2029 domain-containing protein [Bdellovibrionales bacterium]|nr:DUF2029 domain-containing protein [Bdellovibrionales bacterium]
MSTSHWYKLEKSARPLQFLLVLLFILGMSFILSATGLFSPGDPGTVDVVQYWSAFHGWIEGSNPYSPEEMLRIQQTLFPGWVEVITMWNPPWILILLAPVLVWNFELTCSLWFVLSVSSALFGSVLLLKRLGGTISEWRKALGVAFTFFPFFSCLYLGQLGMFLFLGIVFFLIGWIDRRVALLVPGILIISLKPHLFLFLGLFFLIHQVTNFWGKGVVSVCGTAGIVLVIPLVFDLNLYSQWQSLFDLENTLKFTSTNNWKTATLGTQLSLLFGNNLSLFKWVPLLVGVFVLLGRVLLKGLPLLSFRSFFWALLLSVGLSPYAWLFDFSILYSVLLFLVVSDFPFWILLGLNLITLALGATVLTSQDNFWWLPWSVCLLYLLFLKKTVIEKSNVSSFVQ